MYPSRDESPITNQYPESRFANGRFACAAATWLSLIAASGQAHAQSSSSSTASPTTTVTAPNVPAPKTEAPCDCQGERDSTEGAGVFLFGPGLFDFSSLNDRLAANGYERLPVVMPVIGGEGRAVFPSGFVIGGHGAGLLAPDREGPDELQAHFGGGFGMADFGFAPIHSDSLLFTMTGGIGGYSWSLGIGDSERVSFDDVLANPRRSASLSRGGLLVGATLGIDGRVSMGRAERGRRGFFTFGLRVGGLFGPAIGGFSLSEGDEVSGGPNVGLTGAYAALVLGFGGGPAGATAQRP